MIIQSLAPSFSSTFFVKKEPKTPKRERRQREFCKKSNKPPPAGSNFVMVRHKRYRAVGCRSPPSKSLKIVDKVQLEALQKELEDWRPWGVFLLELYLAGEHRSCVPMLVRRYKVSPQTARKYKRQFENFLKKFFADFTS